ncbi:protein jim lovell-like [Anopheles aquasalis]|uniref:protein jim lovell-like n=1 Tax=Anopheles aquasalis TaxID=42839 RepID=UPI00215B056C|nr:protein jim lovell-like [Anopheles aquasalis]
MSSTAAAGLTQQFCVRWNSHLGSLGAAFPQLLAGQRFVDVTLACEGHQVQCHRLVLAACSTYFENLLGENPCQHPIIILPRDIKLWAIQALVDFMYKGEVNVSQAGLPDLMKCAEILKIRGLCGSDAALNLNQIHSPPPPPQRASTGVGASSVSSSGHLSAGSSDLVMPPEADHHHRMTSTKDAPVPNSKNAANSQIQGRTTEQQHHRTHQQRRAGGGSGGGGNGPKGQLLNSLHLQPVGSGVRNDELPQHPDDSGPTSDHGDSSNEVCIKTEDPMIDEDTSSKPCEFDDEELEGVDGADKIDTDAIRCEQQLLDVHAASMEAGGELEEDEQQNGRALVPVCRDGEENDREEVEGLSPCGGGGGSTTTGSDANEPHGADDEAVGSGEGAVEQDEHEVMEVVREETEPRLVVPVAKRRAGGTNGKREERRKRALLSHNHTPPCNNNADPKKSGGPPALQRAAPGSIRVKSLENLFANYHHQTKQPLAAATVKASREKRKAERKYLLNRSEQQQASANSDNSVAEEGFTTLNPADSLVYQRDGMNIYLRPPTQGSANGGSDDGAIVPSTTAQEDDDGYENIICSPNFPQLSGVLGGSYKAEEEDEEEADEDDEQRAAAAAEYGNDRYALELLERIGTAEEIDGTMVLGNGSVEGDSEAEEILFKPRALMGLGKGSGTVRSGGAGSANMRQSQLMRSYGRGGALMSGGSTHTGTSGHGTLTVRKLEPADGGGRGGQTTIRPVRRRLTGRTKEAFNQLFNASGAPPPISFTLRNPRGNQPRSYNTEALWAALMDVKAGESIYRASQMHKVPRKTLRNWMKRWDIKSAYPMPRQLKEAAEKKRIIKELTTQIQ